MKILAALKTEKGQHFFEAALVFLVLLVLPALPLGKYGGGIAMMVASVLGSAAYFLLYREHLRRRGQLRTALFAGVLGVFLATAMTLWLTRHLWN